MPMDHPDVGADTDSEDAAMGERGVSGADLLGPCTVCVCVFVRVILCCGGRFRMCVCVCVFVYMCCCV
jgi:hypothetical protein